MRVISTDMAVRANGQHFEPFARYVVPDSLAQKFKTRASGEGARVLTESHWNSYCRPYVGQPLDGKTLAVFRHGAFGDQLMLTGLMRSIKRRWPKANILYFSAPKVAEIWAHNPDVLFCDRALLFETAKGCDYHLFAEYMLENNAEPDQRNAWEDLYAWAGVEADPSEMVPAIYFGEEDKTWEAAWEAMMKDPYWVYHWSPDNPVRAIPEIQAKEIIRKVSNDTGLRCVVIGKSEVGKEIEFQGNILNLMDKTAFRQLIPILHRARAVVCPDSSMGHLAAAMPGTPVVSLWGPFAPYDRVSTYPNHHPIFPREVCPHSPCRWHGFTIPVAEKCKDASNHVRGVTHCNVLRAITPEEVSAKVRKVMK